MESRSNSGGVLWCLVTYLQHLLERAVDRARPVRGRLEARAALGLVPVKIETAEQLGGGG